MSNREHHLLSCVLCPHPRSPGHPCPDEPPLGAGCWVPGVQGMGEAEEAGPAAAGRSEQQT